MYTIGIDLGTVYTAAATVRDGRAEIFSLGSRATVIPSVVLVREDAVVLVGEAAVRRALLEPSRVAREFKRRLGDSTPIMLGGSPYPPQTLTAHLLRSVVADVSAQFGGPPTSVCVCHPATWGPYRTGVMLEAVAAADLPVPVTLAVEPVAAASHYAQQERVPAGSLVAVYDLGGGTFDSAVARVVGDGTFEVVGRPEGIDHLGGADFDAAVFEHVCTVVGDALSSLDESQSAATSAVAQLRAECTAAKEALSADTATSIPVLLPGTTTEVRLTRAEFEQMIRPALYDTVDALQRTVRSAGIRPDDLHSVLLVGGSSRIPLVAQVVGAALGRPVTVDVHPKHAIALGAALLASATTAESSTESPSESPTHLPTHTSQHPSGSHERLGVAAGVTTPTDDEMDDEKPGWDLPPAADRIVASLATTASIAAPTVPASHHAAPTATSARLQRPSSTLRWALVAVAALAVLAVGAIITQILPTSSSPSPAGRQSTSAPATGTATTAGIVVPAAFAGTWTGQLHQPPGSATGDTATIALSTGATTGTYSLPQLGCQAVLTVTAVPASGTNLQLTEQITADPNHRCAPQALLTLTLLQDSTPPQFTLTWQDAANAANTAAGTLAKG